ncbi:uncharacterized protein LOC143449390 isoform X1 [Clavelina lepadiformis]|uniref:uncharacterized protein LOC143449390 isoform X1 n=1 Tax=Clavelina lepadiformis TaxID=159417 RepID=UPI0040424545
MSVQNTSPSIQASVSLPVASFSTNKGGAEVSFTSEKTQSQVTHQSISKLAIAAMATTAPAQQLLITPESNAAPVKLTTGSIATSAITVSVAPKQIMSGAALISIPTSTRTSVAQAPKNYGKHQLPVRPLPPSSLSHIASRQCSAAGTTATNAMVDPGGGFAPKHVASPLLPAKAGQPLIMAPSLRNPAPSTIKIRPSYAAAYPYQLASQPQPGNSISSNKQPVSVTTHRGPPVLLRPIYSPQSNRPVPLTVSSNSQDSSNSKRPSSIHYQPTTTISISIPARPTSQQDSARIISSSQVTGKPLYQVGLTHSHTSTAPTTTVAATKVQRMVIASQTGTSTSTSRAVSLTTSATSTVVTSVTAFTYSAATTRHLSKATITTSAVNVTKVFTPQPPARIHSLQPSVSGISAHVRTSEFQAHQPIASARQPISVAVTTTQPAASVTSVVTSLATPRTSTPSQAQIMYWPHHLNINSAFAPQNAAPAFVGTAQGQMRPSLNLPVTASSTLQGNPIRINPSNVLVMEGSRVPANTHTSVAFTQGQVLHSVGTTLAGNEQTRLVQPHINTSHVPNMSPKPTILRRQARIDPGINKKLNFTPEGHAVGRMSPLKPSERKASNVEGAQVGGNTKARYPPHELLYPIKPALPGQVSFPKSFVTSNGLPPASKLPNNASTKEYSGSYSQLHGVDKDKTNVQVGRRVQQTVGDVTIKTEPGYPTPFNIKAETASSHLQRPFPSPYHATVNKLQDGNEHKGNHRSMLHVSPPATKPGTLQQRAGVPLVGVPPQRITPLHQQGSYSSNGNIMQQGMSDVSLIYRPGDCAIQKDVKMDPGPTIIPPVGIKREYDKIAMSENVQAGEGQITRRSNHVSSQILPNDEPIGLSPRKKPRKQTHVIAEELPDADQVVDDEMSTDDADECEDEKPFVSLPLNDLKASKDVLRDGKAHKHSSSSSPAVKTSKLSSESKKEESPAEISPTEYVDKNGIRYVKVRERPAITLLGGHRTRTIANHFTHYSDVKVKDKKVTLHDQRFNPKHLKGWKVLQFAAQLEELAFLDADALQRMEKVQEGLLQHARSLFTNSVDQCETKCQSPAHRITTSSPGTALASTPSQTLNLPSSFSKTFPSSCLGTTNSTDSPSTPLERKATRFREEILKIEDMAQANIQRCNVMREQLEEAKTILVKVLDHRTMVTNLVEAGRENQKSNRSSSSNGIRGSKKKKS